MRTISAPALATMNAAEVPVVLMLEMLLSGPVRLVTAPRDIVFNGVTYQAIGDLGNVEEVDDSPGEYKALRYSLSGVRTEFLAIALAENIRDKTCTLRLGVLDPTTHALLDAPLVWTGTLDQMPITIDQSSGTCVISVTAEHRGATYARPKPLRYTDIDQQRLYPGDTSLRFVASQANHQDIWPAASFGRV